MDHNRTNEYDRNDTWDEPSDTGASKDSTWGSRSGAGAASALQSLKQIEGNRAKTQPSEAEHPQANDGNADRLQAL
ncbi:MAG: hypothetical protein V4684_07660 [Pseudomonadota bacterium]